MSKTKGRLLFFDNALCNFMFHTFINVNCKASLHVFLVFPLCRKTTIAIRSAHYNRNRAKLADGEAKTMKIPKIRYSELFPSQLHSYADFHLHIAQSWKF